MTETKKNENEIKNIAMPLLEWYRKNKRDLPWRRTKDPYAILVSEMMLQQTQVNTVIDYYARFLTRFPDFNALAYAEEQAVLALWQGLGYYSRARNLHQLAKQVVQTCGGRLPDDVEALKKLPGIGDYMCGAVMSIAFQKPVPAVDGNVLRVTTRVLNIHEDITKAKTKHTVTEKVAAWMPKNAASDFTQAMMELGALICKPKNPDCGICPLKTVCTALAAGTAEALPVKESKKKPMSQFYYAVLITAEDKLLMQQRDADGLLAGMWGLPLVEKQAGMDIDAVIGERMHTSMPAGKHLGAVSHVFTHRRWEMTVVHYQLGKETISPYGTWIDLDELDDVPIPTAFKKVICMLAFQNREKSEEK